MSKANEMHYEYPPIACPGQSAVCQILAKGVLGFRFWGGHTVHALYCFSLVGACRVVIMDPSWNPASDLQAIDRAYRLGSRRDVRVYRLISAGTLEEIVYSRQLYKQQQSNVAVENAKEPRYFDGKPPYFCNGRIDTCFD